jgi:hypothetical protein
MVSGHDCARVSPVERGQRFDNLARGRHRHVVERIVGARQNDAGEDMRMGGNCGCGGLRNSTSSRHQSSHHSSTSCRAANAPTKKARKSVPLRNKQSLGGARDRRRSAHPRLRKIKRQRLRALPVTRFGFATSTDVARHFEMASCLSPPARVIAARISARVWRGATLMALA